MDLPLIDKIDNKYKVVKYIRTKYGQDKITHC